MDQEKIVLLSACTEYFQQALQFNLTLYAIAKWAFIIALGLAVISFAADLYIKLKKPAEGGGAHILEGMVPEKPSEIIKAVTTFMNALAKAPIWFFVFLLGLTLIWASKLDVPDVCVKAKPQASQSAG